jgi:precorrin-6B methylase 2
MPTKSHFARLAFCFCFLALCTRTHSFAAEKSTNAVAPVYETRAQHDRDGIGTFFMGREIAHVMGHQGADWLERPERDAEENTTAMIESLKLNPGEVVADIGAGTGYVSRKLAKKVGDKGIVYAVEIQQEMLDILTNKAAQAGVHNIKPILGTTKDTKLPASSVDTILLVDVYHEFDFPFEMAESMCKALKPGGRIVFVEYRGEDPKVPIKPLHKMTVAQLRKEMALQPLKWKETIETLPRQHVVIFTKKRGAD